MVRTYSEKICAAAFSPRAWTYASATRTTDGISQRLRARFLRLGTARLLARCGPSIAGRCVETRSRSTDRSRSNLFLRALQLWGRTTDCPLIGCFAPDSSLSRLGYGRLKAVIGSPQSEQPFRSRCEPSRSCVPSRSDVISCEGDCRSGLTGHLRAWLAPHRGGEPHRSFFNSLRPLVKAVVCFCALVSSLCRAAQQCRLRPVSCRSGQSENGHCMTSQENEKQ